jgi:hypothetical protein
VIDTVLLSMLIHKSAEVAETRNHTLGNRPLRDIHRKLVMNGTLGVLAEEISAQMSAHLDLQHGALSSLAPPPRT